MTSSGLPAEVMLVRHGQGLCNATGTIGGERGCLGLSETGRQQSAALAQRIAETAQDRRFDAVLCTPRLRVLQCAQIIAARLSSPLTVVEGLRGQEFGAADGRQWAQVTRAFGGPPAHDPGRPIADGAESWNAYTARVFTVLSAILADVGERRILLIGHGKTTGMAGALLSGAGDQAAAVTDFVLEHGALSLWRQRRDGWRHVPAV
jgi:probable phosphoglycerate mutase